MLPWAINGLPGDDNDKPASRAPQLAQQPLTGLGGGETVREVHQDTPFSMVALTAEDLTGTSAKVRAKNADGSWGPWYDAETLEGVGPDSAVPRGTEPVFVGRTTTVQISVTRPVGAATTGAAPKAPAKPGLGYVPANVEQPFAQNINAVLISPPQAPVDTLAAAIRRHGARAATQHHRPRTMGRRRGDAMREHRVRQRNPGRHRPPHGRKQRLRPAGFGRHRPVDLRVPHPHAGLVRHRLQRTGRQVRPGLRGPRGRNGQTGRGCRTPAASTATPGAWR